jgi:hypothetical protein
MGDVELARSRTVKSAHVLSGQSFTFLSSLSS